jgi:hypothetical protein
MKPLPHLLFIVLSSAIVHTALGQEHSSGSEPHEHLRHRLTISLGHAHIPAGISVPDGEKKWLNLGAFAVDYDYYFTEAWSLGLHSDIVPIAYEVEASKGNDELITRTSPVALVMLAGYRITPHLGIMAGYGLELAKEENLSLIRVGAEYGWEIGEHWELGLSLSYDYKIDTYDTWFLGLGVSRFLGKSHD